MLGRLRTLDYVILLRDSVDDMKSFYHGRLCLTVERDWGEWVELRAGAVLLTLRPRGRPYDGPRSSAGASVQLAFRVAPVVVAACAAELAAGVVEPLEAVRDQGYGHRTVFFRDPEGNVVEIYAEL